MIQNNNDKGAKGYVHSEYTQFANLDKFEQYEIHNVNKGGSKKERKRKRVQSMQITIHLHVKPDEDGVRMKIRH